MKFLLLFKFQTSSGAHSTSYAKGMGGFLPEIKQSEREANHSLPSGTEVKN